MSDSQGQDKEKKRKKQYKRMGKILAAAWEWDASFQDKNDDEVVCLTDVGLNLDQKTYRLGRHGWEDFARDLGGVYNWHVKNKTAKASKAKTCIEKVKSTLTKLDESLSKIAAEHVPSASNDSRSTPKKRKAEPTSAESPGKRKKSANKNSELAQREDRAIELLSTFIEDRGGERSQVASYSARVTRKASGGKFDTNFYNEVGRRFRSMLEVGRFLGLVKDEKTGASGRVRRNSRAGATSKENEAEKKKIRKELEKLRKTHQRAVKALDDFDTDKKSVEYPMDDLTLSEDKNDMSDSPVKHRPEVTPTTCAAARVPDISGFSGVPDNCIADVLMAWNFLCTFERALNLTPIPLDDFVDALVYVPPEGQMGDDLVAPPVYLAEAHLSLIKLLLQDRSSDDWWWSTLESDDTAAMPAALNEEHDTGLDSAPPIKVNIASLLAEVEDPLITTSWISSLESLCSTSGLSRKQFMESFKQSLKLVANKWVLAYLKKVKALDQSPGCDQIRKASKWLCKLIRDARPDLSRASVRKEAILKARAKVVEDVEKLMEKLPDSVATIEDDDVAEMEYEDDDESDESDDEEVDRSVGSRNTARVDEKVASSIPPKPMPTFVDMLLPPSKPNANDEFVNAFTWPHLVGGIVFRTLHRRKRILNETDDSLRDANQHDQLLVPHRRERERMAVARVLTECIADIDSGILVEKAVDHLCSGGNYIDLSPVQRLCILRALIEAAYDSGRVNDVVVGNYKQRISAMKALDTEQRRAKKEAKEKALADEAAAREQLASEAREKFLDEKREEIRQLNEKSKEFSEEVMESLTYEDIIEFDDDIKADYEALPSPDSFNKAEVNKMIVRLQEEAAFDTDALRVITMDELLKREKLELEEMEGQLIGFGGEEALHDPSIDRETLRSIERLSRDVSRAKTQAERLPELREKALDQMKDAIADGTIKVLRSAMAAARKAKLTGPDDETGGTWAVDIMRDAALELDKAKQNKRVFDAQKDLVAKRNRCFIRCDPLGQDRFGNCFWTFNAEAGGHIWVETEYTIDPGSEELPEPSPKPGFVNLQRKGQSICVGAHDMEKDFVPVTEGDFRKFSRQEYHSSGFSPSLVKRHWGCHVTEESLRSVIKLLDSRGAKEDDLKAKLKDSLEAIVESAEKQEPSPEEIEEDEHGDTDLDRNKFRTDGDESVFQTAKASINPDSVDVGRQATEALESAIGAKVRVRLILNETKESSFARYESGEVVGWMMKRQAVMEEGTDDIMACQESSHRDLPVWKVRTERGKTVWCTGQELMEAFIRRVKMEKEHGYYESDSAFLAYRNSAGKFCGKSAEAPYASSPIYLARWMVKREAELYPKLKIRSYDNTWGGKSGARNLWTNSMKDYAYDFSTVQQGLLTLEKAFFELTLGFSEYKDIADPSEATDVQKINVQKALDDPTQRIEIELESIDKSVPGLWNTPLSRAVFIEIVSKCKTTGFLALALDLLCRNTMKYLQRHKLLNVRTERDTSLYDTALYDTVTSSRTRTTRRRMNAWQQQQQYLSDEWD